MDASPGLSGARTSGQQLIVDGERFTVVGAEIHNSSASTIAAIRRSFATVAALGANTVLAPVAWEQFEPREHEFDTTLVDAMLAEAARLELRLILLWFGSWKNGMSTYAPSWVKLDGSRFPRAEVTGRGRIEHLSPFAPATRAADVAAFTALMAHLAEHDTERAVIMVQVENECGLLGDARDRSAIAERVWSGQVPAAVVDAVAASPSMPAHAAWVARGCRAQGTWSAVFGSGDLAEEIFMAHAYSDHVQAVATAGRAVYDVPMFVNAWLDTAEGAQSSDLATEMSGGAKPGVYPSGGPIVRVAPIWRAMAPTLDLLAPDIYHGDFRAICNAYRDASGALLIPEMRRSHVGVAQMMLAVGELGALGVSPFGVDSLTPTDPAWTPLADGYGQLRTAAESLRRFPKASSRGFILDDDNPSIELEFNGFLLRIDTRVPDGRQTPGAPAYGFAIQEEPGQVLLAGRGFIVFFGPASGKDFGILSAEEISEVDGRTVTRRFNGDEIFNGKFAIFPGLGPALDSSAQPIPMSSDMTGIVRYRFYRY